MSTEMTDNVPLSEMIRALRQELAVAMEEGAGEAIRLKVSKVELELELAMTKKAEGGVGAKFWVLSADAKRSKDQVTSHKFKLMIEPTTVNGDPTEVADDTEGEPQFAPKA